MRNKRTVPFHIHDLSGTGKTQGNIPILNIMQISKKRYIQGFGISVVLLGLLRALNPQWAIAPTDVESVEVDTLSVSDTTNMKYFSSAEKHDSVTRSSSIFFDSKRHPIYSVPSYANTFPDINDVQIVAARKYGINPIQQAVDTINHTGLVYVGQSPYYDVAKLRSSAPYLVPRAALLLHDIGRAYFDSLQVKHIPLHRFIVTSLLRTQEHVDKLRRHNRNATENSCHLYATTFDISYNRYDRVLSPDEPVIAPSRSDSLKWVLSEVLRDMREKDRCYVKYEVKQGCFHITVKQHEWYILTTVHNYVICMLRLFQKIIINFAQ